jgi:hypothetical protein
MSLFNSELVEQMKASMDPEVLQEYESKGDQLYNTIDYEKGVLLDSTTQVFQIEQALKSGLLIKDLKLEEYAIMEEAYGIDWVNRFS